VISSHHAQADIEMLQKQGKTVLCDMARGMQAAAASLSAHCTMLHRVAARKHNHLFCCENQRSLLAL
jgi:hypothetical protein